MSRIIGLNTLFLIPNAVGGTENYTRTFIEALEKTDSQNKYFVFCNQENFDTFRFLSPNFQKILCRVSATNRLARILYEQLVFPFVIQSYRCDVIHSLGYVGPILSPAKKIVTIHDANWCDHPEDQSRISGIILKILMALVTRTADLIVTDSTFSRSRLIHFYPQLNSRIQVILPWVGDKLQRELRKLHPHPLEAQSYILSVSGLYPHKRIPYLFDIIGDLRLVLVGKNGLDEALVRKRVQMNPNVTYFPKVSLSTLASLYQHASGFVFPSIYEGFGYPVYEAITAGVPTLVGRKELYESEARSRLAELTFDREKDTKLVSQLFREKRGKRISIGLSEESIQKMISVYDTL